MALNPLYYIRNLKTRLYFSSLSVSNQSFNNSLRLARHLCSSTPLVCIDVRMSFCTLTLAFLC